ncbi:hypothetical protein C8R42DRAFT_684896 [Lentinula raphanica]|nr:hypothetical protein C8R42DRAFT_684896 [Lentinula raphanica]
MRFDIVLFSSLAVYAVSAIPVTVCSILPGLHLDSSLPVVLTDLHSFQVPADNGGNNASPNPNRPGRLCLLLYVLPYPASRQLPSGLLLEPFSSSYVPAINKNAPLYPVNKNAPLYPINKNASPYPYGPSDAHNTFGADSRVHQGNMESMDEFLNFMKIEPSSDSSVRTPSSHQHPSSGAPGIFGSDAPSTAGQNRIIKDNSFGPGSMVHKGHVTPKQAMAFFSDESSSDSSATLSSHGSGSVPDGVFGSHASVPPNVFRGPSHASSSFGKGWVQIAGNHYGANARVNMGTGLPAMWTTFGPDSENWKCSSLRRVDPEPSPSVVVFKAKLNVPTVDSSGHGLNYVELNSVLKEVFKGTVHQQVYNKEIQQINVGDDTLRFTIELINNVNIGGLLCRPGEDISVDVIGNTVAAVKLGHGNWIFAGLGNAFSENAPKSVVFSQIPADTYGTTKVESSVPEQGPAHGFVIGARQYVVFQSGRG